MLHGVEKLRRDLVLKDDRLEITRAVAQLHELDLAAGAALAAPALDASALSLVLSDILYLDKGFITLLCELHNSRNLRLGAHAQN